MFNRSYYDDCVRDDVIEAIRENYTMEEIAARLEDRDAFAEELNDKLWIDDSVTGNGSGSYTFNSYEAMELVTNNSDDLKEALEEFCVENDTIVDKFVNGDWEYFDVTIRCYKLYTAICEALDYYSQQIEEASEEE